MVKTCRSPFSDKAKGAITAEVASFHRLPVELQFWFAILEASECISELL